MELIDRTHFSVPHRKGKCSSFACLKLYSTELITFVWPPFWYSERLIKWPVHFCGWFTWNQTEYQIITKTQRHFDSLDRTVRSGPRRSVDSWSESNCLCAIIFISVKAMSPWTILEIPLLLYARENVIIYDASVSMTHCCKYHDTPSSGIWAMTSSWRHRSSVTDWSLFLVKKVKI